MRLRTMFYTVIVAGVLLILGFGFLLLSRFDIQQNLTEYLARQGLPANARYDRRGWMALEFIGGAVLTLVIIVLLERLVNTARESLRTITILALVAGSVLGLIQTIDGLSNISPDGIIGEVYPAYFFPLNLVMGLVALAVYLPTAVLVTAGGPRAAPAPRY